MLQKEQLLSESVNGVSNNASLNYGGGHSGSAHANQRNGWSNDWDLEE